MNYYLAKFPTAGPGGGGSVPVRAPPFGPRPPPGSGRATPCSDVPTGVDGPGRVPHNGNHMVTNSTRLDRTFGALADPTRRAILAALARGDATVGELARPFAVSRPAISKHLRVLERARLGRRRRDGRAGRGEVDAAPMPEAAQWGERRRRQRSGPTQ